MATVLSGPDPEDHEDTVTRFATPEALNNRGIIVRYDKRTITLVDGPNAGEDVEYWMPVVATESGGGGPTEVEGTVDLGATTLAALEHISVDNFPASQAVTGTFWQATQPVSGTVAVSGSVAVTGTFWQTTQPVSIAGTVTVSGPLTDTQLRATAVPISHASLPASLGTKTAASSFPVTLPSNQIVPVNVVSLTPTNATSTAYESSRVIKSASGYLMGMTGFNSKTTPQYIHIYNLTALPADGTAPTVLFYVQPLSPWSLDFGVNGRFFSTGIVICNSSTGPTKTVGASDCWYDVQYI